MLIGMGLRGIAIGAAVVALAVSIAAVVIVARRPPPVAVVEQVAPPTRTVAAADLPKLQRSVLAMSADGVTVTDPALRASLGLDEHDAITAISGRAVKREFDVYDAILGVAQLGAQTMYVEVSRGGRPLLLRWQIDGDLNRARHDNSLSTFSIPQVSGLPPIDDALLATIERVDDTHARMPRASALKLIDDPSLAGSGARFVPAVHLGATDGFKLYAIRPSSIYARLNLSNGDTVRAINGFEMTSVDKFHDVLATLRNATTVTVDVTRRGQPMILTIEITQ